MCPNMSEDKRIKTVYDSKLVKPNRKKNEGKGNYGCACLKIGVLIASFKI